MITNERQYKITKAEIAKFQEALNSFSEESANSKSIHPAILEAQREALEYKLQQLLDVVKEYEDLKEGRIVTSSVNELKDLPLALIRARIANGLTQGELANKLGMQEQQIQRYEGSRYEAASLKTLIRIAETLGVTIKGDIQLKELVSPEVYNVRNYPFKQMLQRNWFPYVTGSLNEAVNKSAELLHSLFESAGITNVKLAFNKRSIRTKGNLNEFALNAWYAKVMIKAREQQLNTFFDKSFVTEGWMRDLSTLSQDTEGPKKAVERLKDIGIRVAIEPHLEGTHLDGAAFLLDEIFPVIALTLRHDRLDNFWFVLFHELAHVILHLGFDHDMIFDDLDVYTDGIEKEADQFALNAMIPDSVWKKSLVRFSPSNEMIIKQAKILQVHPALVAGRIRRESGKYFQFAELIGQGKVREQFTDELK